MSLIWSFQERLEPELIDTTYIDRVEVLHLRHFKGNKVKRTIREKLLLYFQIYAYIINFVIGYHGAVLN